MFARSKVTVLRLTVIVIVTITMTISALADIKGHFDLKASTSTTTNGFGQHFLNIDATGRGVFFDGLRPNGNGLTLGVAINTDDPSRVYPRGFHELQLLATNGDKLFGDIGVTNLIFGANGVITIRGDIFFYGGTGSYDRQHADGEYQAVIYTQDFTDSSGSHKANTGSFDFTSDDLTGGDLSGPSQGHPCAVAHFEYLGGPNVQRTAGEILIWTPIALAALLLRRARKQKQ
jgi:hypothetical protein